MNELTVNGRTLEVGDSFSVSGERGRFTFRHINADGSIHAWGGTTGREKLRDFRPERITKIHKPTTNRKHNHQ